MYLSAYLLVLHTKIVNSFWITADFETAWPFFLNFRLYSSVVKTQNFSARLLVEVKLDLLDFRVLCTGISEFMSNLGT